MSRATDRRNERARRSRMARNGGVPTIGGNPELPKTQVLLIQLLQQNQGIITLLETLVRVGLGQTEGDINRTQGITFPVITEEDVKKSLADAMEEEMANIAAAEGHDPGEAAEADALDEAIAAGD